MLKQKRMGHELNNIQGYNYWRDRQLADLNRDWLYNQESWIQDYFISQEHPHRQLLIKALLDHGPINSLLELGCSSGPNLALVNKHFPSMRLAGIDANEQSIKFAQSKLSQADLRQGNIEESLPFEGKSFDCIVLDAVLMYVGRDKIGKVIKEIDRVFNKVVVVFDRFDKNPLGVPHAKNHIWARNYPRLFKNYGHKVQEVKLTADTWPNSKGWRKYGYLWVITRK